MIGMKIFDQTSLNKFYRSDDSDDDATNEQTSLLAQTDSGYQQNEWNVKTES